ncbi:MarR family winged helix-turn-helix transcriptional regulator [Subtercola frigoramans]|uniref:DNA-binding MarR family transcriptional regulator n=1 Tax=Subtercola frigoramans TaxID=120298 RepID=A0ABS2L827_9MICO|nr:MarR family transcriptional regulator [Subtercola frigoramans]MBM7473046.1 DNA-binding MarR family transcriptional regulator [Subtercola frigoramans]
MFGQTGPIQAVDGLPAATLVLLRALDKMRSRFASERELTLSELRVLSRIAEARQASPKMLAGSMNLTTGAVTAISDRLVERDLIVRVAHPSDRRAIFLELTPAGEAVMAGVYDDYRGAITAVADTMTGEETELLEGLLLRLATSLGYPLEDGLAGAQSTTSAT